MKFLLIGGYAESLLNFREPLIDALLQFGIEVHAAAPFTKDDIDVRQRLERKGVQVHCIGLNRRGMNPLSDLHLTFKMWRLMRRTQPQCVLCYTVKPVVYGIVSAWLARVPRRFALITGLGYAFQEHSGSLKLLNELVQGLYRFAISKTHKVFFQNPDDQTLFRKLKIMKKSQLSVVVNGSGIDLEKFAEKKIPKPIQFLLIARLLGAKGIREYVGAAAILKAKFPEVIFSLVGWIDDSPDAIKFNELDNWIKKGIILYHGRLRDVREAITNASVYVLPSYYREGTPRTILEAMAMGRPIVTTDAPGCRETVTDGYNGFLVPVKKVEELVIAMQRFIESPDLAVKMGKCSRQIAEDKYDVHKVNNVMMKEMEIV